MYNKMGKKVQGFGWMVVVSSRSFGGVSRLSR